MPALPPVYCPCPRQPASAHPNRAPRLDPEDSRICGSGLLHSRNWPARYLVFPNRHNRWSRSTGGRFVGLRKTCLLGMWKRVDVPLGQTLPGLQRCFEMISTKPCTNCGVALEFEVESLPPTGVMNCPACQTENKVTVTRARYGKPWYPAEAIRSTSSVDQTIIFCYVLCLLMPLAGFFGGIYLMAKKQPGHGCACMAFSVLLTVFWFTLLFS